MRGRKRKPTERQIAEGDPRKRGVHKLDERKATQPKTSKGLPDCPEFLGEVAKESYEFWKQELELMDMDKRPYAQVLTAVSIAWESVVNAYKTKDQRELDRAQKTFRSLASELGFTPAGLERLTVETPDRGEDDLAKILSRPREKKEAIH